MKNKRKDTKDKARSRTGEAGDTGEAVEGTALEPFVLL